MGMNNSTILSPIVWNPKNQRNQKYDNKTWADTRNISIVMNELHNRRNAKINKMKSDGKSPEVISSTSINIEPIIDDMN